MNGIGCVLPVAFLPPGSVPAVGPGTLTIGIPLNPFLIGAHLSLQTVVLDVGLGGNLYFTNGTDLFIRTN